MSEVIGGVVGMMIKDRLKLPAGDNFHHVEVSLWKEERDNLRRIADALEVIADCQKRMVVQKANEMEAAAKEGRMAFKERMGIL